MIARTELDETDHHVIDDLDAYALGILDRDESEAVEEHLAACPACRAALDDAQAVVAGLGLAVAAVAPPPAVRERLLAALATEAGAVAPPTPIGSGRGRSWLLPALAAAAAVLLAGVAVLSVMLARTIDERDDALAEQALIASYVSDGGQLVALKAQPASIYKSSAGRGSLLVAPGKEPIVMVAGCPASNGYYTYRVWFARAGDRVPAGTLTVDKDGKGWLKLTSPEPVNEYDTIGITVVKPDASREDVLVGDLALNTAE